MKPRRLRRSTPGSLAVAALAVAACGDDGGAWPDDAAADAPLGTLAILPATIHVPVGRTQHFVAAHATTFVVEEGGGGGTVDASGRYVAPLTPGTYHVRAENDGARGVATVYVEAVDVSLAVGRLGGVGNADGAGALARFNQPFDVAGDGAGTIYVADIADHVIRKVTLATGETSVLAGASGQLGAVDGVGVAARFYQPHSIVYDASTAALFVSDLGNHTIRKIDLATAAVTTVAGTAGVIGNANGVGAAASFTSPAGLALSDGTLYIADNAAHVVRSLDVASSTVSTTAGTAGASGSDGTHLARPAGVAVRGRLLYIADTQNHAIRTFDLLVPGSFQTFAGMVGTPGSGDGVGTSARLDTPHDLIFLGADLYVSDMANRKIRRIASDKTVTTVAGTGTAGHADGAGATATFMAPTGIGTDGDAIAIADSEGHSLRVVPVPAYTVSTLAGMPHQPGSSDGAAAQASLHGAGGLAIDAAGDLYFTDSVNATVRRLSSGAVATLAGSVGVVGVADGVGGAAELAVPRGLTLNGDLLYVTQALDPALRRMSLTTTLVDTPYAPATTTPTDCAIAQGALYVTTIGNTITRIDLATGIATTAFGAGTAMTIDGQTTAASFDDPAAIVADGQQRLFVAERNGRVVRQIDLATGAVTTLAGAAGADGAQDGIGVAARFGKLGDLAYDAANELLYVADRGNHTVRRIYVPTGAVSTVAGLAGVAALRPGPVETATLNDPIAIALRANGTLVVASGREAAIVEVGP